MPATLLLALALAASTTLAVTPPGARPVYITSAQDQTFAVAPTSRAVGATLVVQSFTSSPQQTWYVKANETSIQLADSTLCMDAGPQSAWRDMASVYVRECADTEQQRWNVMPDGRIAVAGSTGTQQCLDLQYLRATQNNPVGLYNCAGLGNTGAKDKGINWPLVDAAV
ncbi:hypothetical protein ACN47E_009673 [Coniothyrium glycines]